MEIGSERAGIQGPGSRPWSWALALSMMRPCQATLTGPQQASSLPLCLSPSHSFLFLAATDCPCWPPVPLHPHQFPSVSAVCCPSTSSSCPCWVVMCYLSRRAGVGMGRVELGQRPCQASGDSHRPSAGVPPGARELSLEPRTWAPLHPYTQRLPRRARESALAPTAVRTHAQLHKDVHILPSTQIHS